MYRHTHAQRYTRPDSKRFTLNEEKKMLQHNEKYIKSTDSINPSQTDFHNCRKEIRLLTLALSPFPCKKDLIPSLSRNFNYILLGCANKRRLSFLLSLSFARGIFARPTARKKKEKIAHKSIWICICIILPLVMISLYCSRKCRDMLIHVDWIRIFIGVYFQF